MQQCNVRKINTSVGDLTVQAESMLKEKAVIKQLWPSVWLNIALKEVEVLDVKENGTKEPELKIH